MSRLDRKALSDYHGDVAYQVWRSGGNPDRVNPDRVTDGFYGGETAGMTARREMERQKPPPHEHEWQWSIHDAMKWCACGAQEYTPTEEEMEGEPE